MPGTARVAHTTATDWRCLLFTILYAQQNIVGVCVFFLNIIGVITGYDFYVVALRHFDQNIIYTFFVLLVVAHNFHIKVIAKHFLPPKQGFLGLVFAYVQNLSGHFPIKASR